MKTRIMVDLLGFTGARGGTETYVREVVSRLPSHLRRVEFIALTGRVGGEAVREFFPGSIHSVGFVGSGKASWALGELVAAERSARRVGADLLWTPQNFGPVVRGLPRVATIHDVIYHEVAAIARPDAARFVTAWLMERSARSADEVITVSATAREAIVSQMGIAASKVHVVRNGFTPPRRSDDTGAALQSLGIDDTRPIVLSVGNRMPHKNMDGLLRALAEIDPARRPLAVLAGGGERDPLRPLVASAGLGGDVVLPGWVTDDQLEALYDRAALYVCPSLTEGFGLPVVDALARGVPVLANDISVLREVGGPVTSYADATASKEFASAISRCLATAPDEGAAERKSWASAFTWEAAAEGTAEVLESAIGTPRVG